PSQKNFLRSSLSCTRMCSKNASEVLQNHYDDAFRLSSSPLSTIATAMVCALSRRASFIVTGLLSAAITASCQTPASTIPAGTPLPVQTTTHLPMRTGPPSRAELLSPVYADNTLALPAKTVFIGTVTELRSDHSRRIQARINGDFTPYHIPVVRFSQVVL